MSASMSIEMTWDVQQLPSLQQALHKHAMAHGWDETLQARVNLVAEELVVNAMTHGHEGRDPALGPGWVRVQLAESGEDLTLVVTDNGVPYDPTQPATVDLDAPLDERSQGGLGLHLIRQLAQSLSYDGRSGCNVVTVCLRRSLPT